MKCKLGSGMLTGKTNFFHTKVWKTHILKFPMNLNWWLCYLENSIHRNHFGLYSLFTVSVLFFFMFFNFLQIYTSYLFVHYLSHQQVSLWFFNINKLSSPSLLSNWLSKIKVCSFYSSILFYCFSLHDIICYLCKSIWC